MGSLRNSKSTAEWEELADHLEKSLAFISRYKELGTPTQIEKIIGAYQSLGTPQQIKETFDTITRFAESYREKIMDLEQRLNSLEKKSIIYLFKTILRKIGLNG